MLYLTKHQLYGFFLPVTQPLSYGVSLDGKGKEPLRSPSGSEETTQIHLDMLTLLSAGIHPHFLLHHHLIHPSTDPFSGDSPDKGVPTDQTSTLHRSCSRVNPGDISPHRIIPDYPFVSAARYLVKANMKEARSTLLKISEVS
jgi:hypothetical protein